MNQQTSCFTRSVSGSSGAREIRLFLDFFKLVLLSWNRMQLGGTFLTEDIRDTWSVKMPSHARVSGCSIVLLWLLFILIFLL